MADTPSNVFESKSIGDMLALITGLQHEAVVSGKQIRDLAETGSTNIESGLEIESLAKLSVEPRQRDDFFKHIESLVRYDMEDGRKNAFLYNKHIFELAIKDMLANRTGFSPSINVELAGLLNPEFAKYVATRLKEVEEQFPGTNAAKRLKLEITERGREALHDDNHRNAVISSLNALRDAGVEGIIDDAVLPVDANGDFDPRMALPGVTRLKADLWADKDKLVHRKDKDSVPFNIDSMRQKIRTMVEYYQTRGEPVPALTFERIGCPDDFKNVLQLMDEFPQVSMSGQGYLISKPVGTVAEIAERLTNRSDLKQVSTIVPDAPKAVRRPAQARRSTRPGRASRDRSGVIAVGGTLFAAVAIALTAGASMIMAKLSDGGSAPANPVAPTEDAGGASLGGDKPTVIHDYSLVTNRNLRDGLLDSVGGSGPVALVETGHGRLMDLADPSSLTPDQAALARAYLADIAEGGGDIVARDTRARAENAAARAAKPRVP